MSPKNDLRNTIASLHPMQLFDAHVNQLSKSFNVVGSFIMPLKTPSKDPEYSRPYYSGDLVSRIDWKAYARTDQLLIREKREESAIKTLIVCDSSDNMHWPNKNVLPLESHIPTKFELAVRIALNLAHIHIRMGDQVSLVHLNQQGTYRSMSPKYSHEILSIFEQLAHKNFLPAHMDDYFKHEYQLDKKQDKVYWISDTLNHSPDETILAQSRSCSLLHTLSSLELDISWMKDQNNYYSVHKQKKEFVGKDLKKNMMYDQKLKKWIHHISHKIRQYQGKHHIMSDLTPLHEYFQFIS